MTEPVSHQGLQALYELHYGSCRCPITESELARAERSAPTDVQQTVQEVAELFHRSQELALGGKDAKVWSRLPEVAPAAGQHARAHGLLRLQEAENVMEDFVREGVDALALWRHSVEESAGVGSAGQVTVSDIKWPSTWAGSPWRRGD
jgi:hypothetical protein